MGVMKRRTHIVNFRLSEDEYESLKNVCLTEGARSISDFARAAVCRSITGHSSSPSDELYIRVSKLDDRVEELDRAVRRINEIVVRSNGSDGKCSNEGLLTAEP